MFWTHWTNVFILICILNRCPYVLVVWLIEKEKIPTFSLP